MNNSTVVDSLMDSANSNPGYLYSGYLYGINTITTSLGRKHNISIDISKLPIPKNYVGPWEPKTKIY